MSAEKHSAAAHPKSGQFTADSPLRGYRLWFAPRGPDGTYTTLHSTGRRDHVWPARDTIEADCLRRELVEVKGSQRSEARASCGTRSPAPGCTCGVYVAPSPSAYDRIWPFDDPLRHIFPESGPGLIVMGEVEGWGRAIEHEHGWRVQFARLVSLVFPESETLRGLGMPEALEQLGARYEVPVTVEEEFGLVVGCSDETCRDKTFPHSLLRKRLSHKRCRRVLFCTKGWLV